MPHFPPQVFHENFLTSTHIIPGHVFNSLLCHSRERGMGFDVLFKNALTHFVEAKTILLKYYHDLLEVNQQINHVAP